MIGADFEDRRDDEEMEKDAQCRDAENRGKRCEEKRPAEEAVQPEDHVHAAHDELGVADPHHVDDAKDEVEAERLKGQHAAEKDAVDDRFKEVDVHRPL